MQLSGGVLNTLILKRERLRSLLDAFVEPSIRLELMTCRLQGGCSTN